MWLFSIATFPGASCWGKEEKEKIKHQSLAEQKVVRSSRGTHRMYHGFSAYSAGSAGSKSNSHVDIVSTNSDIASSFWKAGDRQTGGGPTLWSPWRNGPSKKETARGREAQHTGLHGGGGTRQEGGPLLLHRLVEVLQHRSLAEPALPGPLHPTGGPRQMECWKRNPTLQF